MSDEKKNNGIEETTTPQAKPEAVAPSVASGNAAPVRQMEQKAESENGNSKQPVVTQEVVVSNSGETPQNVQNGNHSTNGDKVLAERPVEQEEKNPEKNLPEKEIKPAANGAKGAEKKTVEEEQKSPKKIVPGKEVKTVVNGVKAPEKKAGNEEQKNLEKALPEKQVKTVSGGKNQPDRRDIPRYVVGGNRSSRPASSKSSQTGGEEKVIHQSAKDPGQGEGSPKPPTEKPPSGVVVTAQAAIENEKVQLQRAFEFVDPTEPLGGFEPVLPLGDQVGDWVSRLTQTGFLLLQCADRNVLRSAGYAIAGAKAFSSWRRRALKFGPWKWAEEPDKLHKMLFHDQMTEGGQPTLIVVFGYWRKSEPFLQNLPEDEEIEAVESRRRDSLRIVVLVTPDRLRAAGQPVPFSQDYAFPPVDFLSPLLREQFPETVADRLAGDLRRQFEHKLWGDNEEEFHKSFVASFRSKKLEIEVERRNQLLTQSDPVGALRRLQSELSSNMLGDKKPLENAVIFTATYFEDLPADEFQRVLLSLLGERTIDVAVPGPLPTTPDNATPIVPTRPKLLRQIWGEERQAILSKCRLRILPGDPPAVGFESADLRESLKKRFESEFFFLFDDLCGRVMETRLFFDLREDISEAIARLLIRRIKSDPSGYGQSFLHSLVVPLASGRKAEDRGITERLRSVLDGLNDDRRRDLYNRLGTLLNSLVEAQVSSPLEGILRTLVDFGRHDDALQLLSWIIHPSFLTRRVEVLRRIVNEGPAEMRDKVGRHLQHWARNGGGKTATLLQTLHGWCDNRPTPSAKVANEFFVELCALCIVPPATWENHPIALALAACESETCFQDIASWLLSIDSSSAKYLDVEHSFGWILDPGLRGDQELQFIVALILSFTWIMPRSTDQGGLHATLNSGGLSQAILLIWFISYERALMLGLPGLMPPEIYAGTLRATLIADCALALRNQGNGFQDVDRLAKAVARLDRSERAALLAHWSAMASALGDCLAVPRSSRFAFQAESAAARKKLIERWSAIRSGLTDFRSRVLSAVANAAQ